MNLKKSFCLLAAAAVATISWSGALRGDSPSSTQWIVTSAKVQGAGGEQFVTSLRIVNPNAVPATVSLTFLAQSALDGSFSATGDNSAATAVTVTVPAGQTVSIEDVVGTKFSGSAPAGGIKVVTDPATPVSVISQTLVTNARSATGAAGTFGFAIPSQTTDQAVAVGDVAYIPYVAAAPDGATTGYRTNLFFLNTFNGTSVVNVKLQKGDGTILGQRDYTLGKLSQTQQNRVAASFGYATADTNLTLVITVKSGGPVVVGTSVIDNAISSISYTPPVKTVFANNGIFAFELEDGGYGFSGRVDIFNGIPDFITAGIVLDTCPGGAQLFFIQGFTSGAGQNATFTKNADGTYSGSGTGTGSSWTATIRNRVDGTIDGTIVYTRAAGTAGGTCAGVSKSFSFIGAKVVPLTGP
ncbi:MAG: hypothetical protein ABIT01_16770 [Thermoanaerobaculia bacterium]